jgi:RNA polymerase sigma factor (sigma-70 family)
VTQGGGTAAVAAVEDAHRREWAFVLAATVRVTRDLDVAQECAQDAYAKALETWPRTGVPSNPGAWLTTVSRNRALDLIRRDATLRRKLPVLVMDAADTPESGAGSGYSGGGPDAHIPDDRLRLVFTCCHPALSREAQVALTLRLVCGVATPDVARAFLVSEATMAARITRAKRKIAAAGIPYRVPERSELADRVDAVLSVVHLLFTVGHTAPSGSALFRSELLDRAIGLARMVRELLPGQPEPAGLLALTLLIDSRRGARIREGAMVLLEDQDRGLWDRSLIVEGDALVRQALRGRPPGRFAIQAAIAAVHAGAPNWEATDWREILGLYDVLLRIWPSPVVALNRAAALGFAVSAQAGLDALDKLGSEPSLVGYPYLCAARADFLRRLGRDAEARSAYGEALLLTENAVEREFLLSRMSV